LLQIRIRFYIILILVSIFLLFTGCSSPKPPKLVLSEESWHYGEVRPDEKRSHKFILENKGSEELIIESVYSSCGCIETVLSKKNIPAGKKAELEAIFDPYGYEGEITKHVTIKSNDPENPEKKIELNITVLHVPNPDMTLSRQMFNLGDIDRGISENLAIQFTISNNGDADLIIEEFVLDDIFNHGLNFPIVILPGEKYEIELSLNMSQLSEGKFRKTVRIKSNDPQNQTVFIRISGNAIEETQ